MTVALEGGEWAAARPGRTLPPEKDPVPIVQEAGWAPGPVWTGGKSRPHRDSIPDRQARSQRLYNSIQNSLAHTITVEQLSEALRYKPQCRGFYTRWGHGNFFMAMVLPATLSYCGSNQPLTEISTRDICWGKGGRGLTLLPSSTECFSWSWSFRPHYHTGDQISL